MSKYQIIFIHGGETFATYEDYFSYLEKQVLDPYEEKPKKWRESLEEELGEGYEVVILRMPSRSNAKYKEWRLWFEKLVPYMRDNVVFVGHSLGGLFLAKYFSENSIDKKISATYLIAPPYDEKDSDYSLADFVLPKSLKKLGEGAGKIFIYHSEDDPIVPFADAKKYKKALPSAELVIFKNKGHFLEEKFPELIKSIKYKVHKTRIKKKK